MFQRLTEVEEKLARRLLVCRVDLADDAVKSAAKLLIIPVPGPYAFTQAIQALQRQIPLLVPEAAEELKDLCLTTNAGLFYGNAEELQECLLLLLSDDPLRQAMGRNGKEAVRKWVTASGISQHAP
jgi:glycosyltransferase involved in cell wall biosynthesis